MSKYTFSTLTSTFSSSIACVISFAFLNLDEFHAAVVCANLVGYILKIQKRKNSIDHILKGVKQLVDVGIPLDEKTERGL